MEQNNWPARARLTPDKLGAIEAGESVRGYFGSHKRRIQKRPRVTEAFPF